MRLRSRRLAFAALLIAVAVPMHVYGQSSDWQTIYNQAGYQYQVPGDWIPGDVKNQTDTYMGSLLLPEAAYVEVSQPPGSTSAAKLQALMATVLTPSDGQSAYTVTNPSAQLTSPGADAAGGAAAAFTWRDGTPSQEYIVALVSGTTGYALIVDLPLSVDAASPALAQTILASFLLGAQVASPPAPAATPAPAFRTPTPFPSAASAGAVPASNAPSASSSGTLPSATGAPAATSTPTPAPAPVAVTSTHTYYASAAPNATVIYCNTDPAWVTINPANLVSFSSLGAALTAVPGGVLHKPC